MSKMRTMQVRQTASAQLARSKISTLIILLTWFLPLAFPNVGSGQQGPNVQGTVFDTNRAPVQNVRIEFRSLDGTRLTTTDENGKFNLTHVGSGTLLVSYPGFAPVEITVGPEALSDPLQIYLQPAPISARIIVPPVGTNRIDARPNSQFSISKQEIEVSGSLALDDVLREAAGFTLFRRSGSLFANPTSQGVSLRGVGASGASRAVVLLDGVPLNTPFGGWVYWDRVSKLSIESVEVVNGPTSHLYGSGALGGVVNMVTARVRE